MSSPCVHIKVHRPRRAISPRITKGEESASNDRRCCTTPTVHKHSLGNIVSVMTRDDVVYIQHRSSPVKGLSAEHATEGAVVLFADLGDDCVHRPAVEVVVA